MGRHHIPRFDGGRWSGSALTKDPALPRPCQHDEVNGFCFCIQWLGLMIEIGTGRVS